MIAIIDYGMGNLGSVLNMLRYIKADAIITNKQHEILNADKLIIPGVGAFKKGMEHLESNDLIDILNEMALINKIPILGICLGMQLMTHFSEEGNVNGLGWFDANTVRFKFPESNSLKVPHMGWNVITPQKNSALLNALPDPAKFYFVHSYYIEKKAEVDVLATCNYGSDFVCALEKDNLYATQFHPEKSHKYGMKLLQNFASI
jgi:imidazole glycerol-phosphate synthase subunit HisH